MPTEVRTVLQTRLRDALGPCVRFDVGLARYTSFRIGGPADIFVEPNTPAQLQVLLRMVAEYGLPCFLLGGGTNVLVSDKGVRGVVVRLGRGFDYAEWESQPEQQDTARVRVGAGRSLGRFVREAARKGYGGLEFAEGIPGRVGGGLLMNAGAFGGERSAVVETITGLTRTGRPVRLSSTAIGFAYRTTALPPQCIVSEVVFCLPPKPPASITAALQQAREKRNHSQPHGYPNAGSIFKNPPGRYAGRIIEAVGCKGSRQGQAQVSEQHANFIVNTGGATASQVWQLIQQVQRQVWQEERVWLEPEVRRVGEW